jgi:hypothetical protein
VAAPRLPGAARLLELDLASNRFEPAAPAARLEPRQQAVPTANRPTAWQVPST